MRMVAVFAVKDVSVIRMKKPTPKARIRPLCVLGVMVIPPERKLINISYAERKSVYCLEI